MAFGVHMRGLAFLIASILLTLGTMATADAPPLVPGETRVTNAGVSGDAANFTTLNIGEARLAWTTVTGGSSYLKTPQAYVLVPTADTTGATDKANLQAAAAAAAAAGGGIVRFTPGTYYLPVRTTIDYNRVAYDADSLGIVTIKSVGGAAGGNDPWIYHASNVHNITLRNLVFDMTTSSASARPTGVWVGYYPSAWVAELGGQVARRANDVLIENVRILNAYGDALMMNNPDNADLTLRNVHVAKSTTANNGDVTEVLGTRVRIDGMHVDNPSSTALTGFATSFLKHAHFTGLTFNGTMNKDLTFEGFSGNGGSSTTAFEDVTVHGSVFPHGIGISTNNAENGKLVNGLRFTGNHIRAAGNQPYAISLDASSATTFPVVENVHFQGNLIDGVAGSNLLYVAPNGVPIRNWRHDGDTFNVTGVQRMVFLYDADAHGGSITSMTFKGIHVYAVGTQPTSGLWTIQNVDLTNFRIMGTTHTGVTAAAGSTSIWSPVGTYTFTDLKLEGTLFNTHTTNAEAPTAQAVITVPSNVTHRHVWGYITLTPDADSVAVVNWQVEATPGGSYVTIAECRAPQGTAGDYACAYSFLVPGGHAYKYAKGGLAGTTETVTSYNFNDA